MPDINELMGATVNDNGEYIKPGNYKFKLLKTMFFSPRGGGEAFIAEFEVLESDNPFHQVGTKATFYQKMSGPAADVAPGAIKAVCFALMKYKGDPNTASPEVINTYGQYLHAMGKNPGVFGPALVSCEAHMGELKKTKGKEFCYITISAWALPEGDWTAKPTPSEPAVPQTCLSGVAVPPVPAPTVVNNAAPVQQGFYNPPAAPPQQPQDPPHQAPPQQLVAQPTDTFNGPPPGTYSTPGAPSEGWTPPPKQ